MKTREQALQDIFDIATQHELGLREIENLFEDTEHREKKGANGILPRLFAYLGGTFVFAGLGVFIGMNWDEMNSAARIIITLGSGITAFIIAVVAHADARYEKATTPLFLIAAALQPTGMLVTFNELSSGGDWHYAVLITTGVMLAQHTSTFWKTQRTSLLFMSLVFGAGFFSTAMDLMHADQEFIGLVLGTSLLCIAVAIDKTVHRVITPFWYLAGSVLFLYSFFDLMKETPVDILFLGVACAMVYVSTYVRSRTLLAVSTLGILGYIGYFTDKHFVNSLGWPIALVLLGLTMIGLSAVAFKIGKKYIQNAPPAAW